jgi:hypothetical protein
VEKAFPQKMKNCAQHDHTFAFALPISHKKFASHSSTTMGRKLRNSILRERQQSPHSFRWRQAAFGRKGHQTGLFAAHHCGQADG